MWAVSTFQWSHVSVYDLLLFRWSPKQACKISSCLSPVQNHSMAPTALRTQAYSPQIAQHDQISARPMLLSPPSLCSAIVRSWNIPPSPSPPVVNTFFQDSPLYFNCLFTCFSHDCNLPIRLKLYLFRPTPWCWAPTVILDKCLLNKW